MIRSEIHEVSEHVAAKLGARVCCATHLWMAKLDYEGLATVYSLLDCHARDKRPRPHHRRQ